MINEDTKAGWQSIADMLSRQRPYVGRWATVIRGKKLKGDRVKVLRHQIDAYEDVFRYGGSASHHMRAMDGRSGYVCLVESAGGMRAWVKAKYLVCDYSYDHWSVALADAVRIS